MKLSTLLALLTLLTLLALLVTERLLDMVESTGGATREQLMAKLGMSPGHDNERVAAALAQASARLALYQVQQ